MPMHTRSATNKRSSPVLVDSTSRKRANSKEGSVNGVKAGKASSKSAPSADAAHFKEGRKRTRQAKRIPAKRNSHPTAPLNSDWMLAPEYFKLLDEWFGPFDVDCCAAKDGNNKQPTCKEHWFEDGKNCFDQTWDGKRIYCKSSVGRRVHREALQNLSRC